MISIRFPDPTVERRALGYLAGRFSFRSYASGETVVPEGALAALAVQGISFSVQGPASYEQSVPPVRNAPSAAVQ